MAYQGASYLSFLAKRELAPRRAVILTPEGVDYPNASATNFIGVLSSSGAKEKFIASVITSGVAELETVGIPNIGDRVVVDNEGRATTVPDSCIQTPFICVGIVSSNIIEVLVK